MRRRKLFQLIWILLGVALVSWQIYTPSAFCASAPGVTDDTITIGLTTPMTGPASLYAKVGEMSECMFWEWGKNINGRNIKTIKLDDGCDPVKGIAAVKKLIFDEKVFMLFSGQCSNMCLAVKPTVEQAGIPLISSSCVAAAMYIPVVKNIFNPVAVSTATSETMADFFMTIPGGGRFGVIRHSDEWATSLSNPLFAYMKEKYNKVPVVDVAAERGSADVTSQVLRLKQANLDGIFCILFPAETTAFLRDAHKLGLSVPMIGGAATYVTDQYESLKSVAPLKKYFGCFQIGYPLDHPRVKVYENLLKKYYPNTKFDAFAISVTGGPLVIIDALKKCGRDLTWEKFINILETQYHNWDPENYIGAVPLSFSKTNHVGMDRLVMSTIATGKLNIIKTYQDYEKLMR
jgi:branched-chain amino acid transport system substrate-binding protein